MARPSTRMIIWIWSPFLPCCPLGFIYLFGWLVGYLSLAKLSQGLWTLDSLPLLQAQNTSRRTVGLNDYICM